MLTYVILAAGLSKKGSPRINIFANVKLAAGFSRKGSPSGNIFAYVKLAASQS